VGLDKFVFVRMNGHIVAVRAGVDVYQHIYVLEEFGHDPCEQSQRTQQVAQTVLPVCHHQSQLLELLLDPQQRQQQQEVLASLVVLHLL